jgi:penicillin-binding protein 1A
MMRVLQTGARAAFLLLAVAAIGIGGCVGLTLAYAGRHLPDVKQIAEYVPAVGSKVYAGDGSLMGEFETEHRIPVTLDAVPKSVVEAFLAAEDRDFYKHGGVNPVAIFRAALTDLLRLPKGERPIGASTITQQVVRHFLLSDKVSIVRKIKEAILAYRVERTLSKNRILEIYLNEIYLGAGAYGVAAAADTYFGKPLARLTLAEAATLAALPKAPSDYNPIRHPQAALRRRNWVLAGMAEVGWITAAQQKAASAAPLGVRPRPTARGAPGGTPSGYFREEVRRELIARFGDKAVYRGGLTVRTSYLPAYQEMAETAFRNGLLAYDRRHGWRGPLAHEASAAAARAALLTMTAPPAPPSWQLAAVTAIDREGATVALQGGGAGRIPLAGLRWARRTRQDQRLGPPVRRVGDVVVPGDIVLVEPALAAPAGRRRGRFTTYALRQIPNVGGGIVVMDPKTGRVFALVGGWSFGQSQFDRAVQALRQPGSAFKPFVYVTALEKGFTPDSMVDDEPVAVPQGPGLPLWQPANYEAGYVGPTTLEDALVHSRNLATVHVALAIGLPAIARTAENFGVLDRMPLYYAMVLGAGDTTLMRMTTAYAMIDDGGRWLTSSLIDLVQDRHGRILYQKGIPGCPACFVAAGPHNGGGGVYRAAGRPARSTIRLPHARYAQGAVLYRPKKPDPLVTPQADRQLVAMMQGVVEHGTGVVVSQVGRPLAGKTGTTNDWVDAWFVGFSPDLAAGVYVGFDEPRTLGRGEVGGRVAAPIFRDFMMAALQGKPAMPFPAPAGATEAVASAAPDAPDNPQTEGAPPEFPAPWRWSGYQPPRPRDYAAARAPYYPAPWAPYFAAPGYGAPPGSRYGRGYPAYPPPGWGGPRFGTGGLY